MDSTGPIVCPSASPVHASPISDFFCKLVIDDGSLYDRPIDVFVFMLYSLVACVVKGPGCFQ